jgi:NTE family protein
MPRRVRRIDLALQGGGALGAYTWGVLDRLLEDERVGFGAISGASAGAMNAVLLADGLARGGRRGAREALRSFWMRVSNASGRGPLSAALLPLLPWALPALATAAPPWAATAPWNVLFESWGRALAPAQFDPLDANPLRTILAEEVDFERLRAFRGVRVSVSATQVRSGRLREFAHEELSIDAVMASACLPLLFRTVVIDGEAYWDGGYVANPSLLPLVAHGASHDLVLVQINPSRREAVPTQAQEIADRIDEIVFNGSLERELRTLALLQQLLAESPPLPAGRAHAPLFEHVAALRLHRIESAEPLARPGTTQHLDASWAGLSRLHHLGRECAQHWLQTCYAHVGRRSTLALADCLAGLDLPVQPPGPRPGPRAPAVRRKSGA